VEILGRPSPSAIVRDDPDTIGSGRNRLPPFLPLSRDYFFNWRLEPCRTRGRMRGVQVFRRSNALMVIPARPGTPRPMWRYFFTDQGDVARSKRLIDHLPDLSPIFRLRKSSMPLARVDMPGTSR